MTLTTIVGSTDAQAHAFSYWVAEDAYAQVQDTIDAFLVTNFPGFSIY
jgi:hypothetical protein